MSKKDLQYILKKLEQNLTRNSVIEEYLIEKGFKLKRSKKIDLHNDIGNKNYVLALPYKKGHLTPLARVYMNHGFFNISISYQNISTKKHHHLLKTRKLSVKVSQKESNYITKCFESIDYIMENIEIIIKH